MVVTMNLCRHNYLTDIVVDEITIELHYWIKTEPREIS